MKNQPAWIMIGDCFRCGKPYEIVVGEDSDGHQRLTCSHDGCDAPVVQAVTVQLVENAAKSAA
jgi:hypothetical protein